MAAPASPVVWVVGLDASEPAQRALDYAIDRARHDQAPLVVVSAVDWQPTLLFPENIPAMPVLEAEWFERARDDLMASARRRLLDPAREKAEAAGVECETEVRFGAPATELLAALETHKATSVAVGRSGERGLRAEFFGGVAAAVLHHAECVVHIVP